LLVRKLIVDILATRLKKQVDIYLGGYRWIQI